MSSAQAKVDAENMLMLSHRSKKSFTFLDALRLCQPSARGTNIGLLVRPSGLGTWPSSPAERLSSIWAVSYHEQFQHETRKYPVAFLRPHPGP